MRRQLTALAIALAVNAALWGCAFNYDPPQPFPAGKPTIEPPGCEDLRKRGGEC